MKKLLLYLVVALVLLLPNTAFSQNSPNMSFFITSAGPGNGANLGGLTGADAICQRLAAAAGAGNKTWRAYLSTSATAGQPAVNARDRIGKGPWQNVKGVVVAKDVNDLHSDNNKLGKENSLTEKGTPVNGRGDNPNTHDMLTGSGLDGKALPGDLTCNNWTSSSAGSAQLGHFDKQGGGENPNSWNSAHASYGCSQANLVSTGGAGAITRFRPVGTDTLPTAFFGLSFKPSAKSKWSIGFNCLINSPVIGVGGQVR